MAQRPVIYWFRNDLRLHDNEALYKAAQKTSHLVPVYCLDPRQFGITTYSLQKTGRHRTKFLLESLSDLRQSLQKIGSNLIVRMGRPEDILPELALDLDATDVYYTRKLAHDEVNVEELLTERLSFENVEAQGFWGNTLYHPNDLPFEIDEMPATFPEFRRVIAESNLKIRRPLPSPQQLSAINLVKEGDIPTLPRLGFPDKPTEKKSTVSFKGGEHEALLRLHEFVWERDLLSCCKETRNALLGADFSSKLSPWLSNGSLSARLLYDQVKEYEAERVSNESTAWVIQELMGRDFFRFLSLKFGTLLFQEEGIKGHDKHQPEDQEKFKHWKKGRTGIPFIDAAMRELNATGFISFRARQAVASFLVNDLQLNWLMGAEYFESRLIDYDVASNYGNWNYVAGVAHNTNPDKSINILRQAQQLDPEGAYVKYWLPELDQIPAAKVHRPWLLSVDEQQKYGVKIGTDYPEPMVALPVN